MLCPDDSATLVTEGSNHQCPQCRGRLVPAADVPKPFLDKLEMETREDSGAFDKTKRCPACETVMTPWRFEHMQSWIDRCPSCDHFWLDTADQKNIDRIAKRLAREAAVEQLPEEDRRQMAAELARSERHAPSISPFHAALAWIGLPVITRTEGSRTPFATWTIALLLVLVFLLTADPRGLSFVNGSGTIFDAFTATFTHFGWLHLLGNTYFLLAFGDGVEQRLPRPIFVIGFIIFGTLSILIDGLFEGPETVIAGASGAVAVIMGCAVMLQPKARVTTRIAFSVVNIPIVAYAAIEVGYQLMMWWFDAPGTAWVAHITGIIFGLLLGRLVAFFTVPRPAAA